MSTNRPKILLPLLSQIHSFPFEKITVKITQQFPITVEERPSIKVIFMEKIGQCTFEHNFVVSKQPESLKTSFLNWSWDGSVKAQHCFANSDIWM